MQSERFAYSTLYVSFEAGFVYLVLFLCLGCARSTFVYRNRKYHLLLPLISVDKTKGSLAACSFSDLLLNCGSLVCTVNTHQFQVACILSCIHRGLFNLHNHAKSGCVQQSATSTKRKVVMCKELHKNILTTFLSQGFLLPVVLT